MNNSKKLKKVIAKKHPELEISPAEVMAFGLREKEEEKTIKPKKENPYVVMKYYQSAYECLSAWTQDELKSFSDFLQKLSERSWQEIISSGGKLGNKTGLGYTPHKDRDVLPKSLNSIDISEDIVLFELRVTKKVRVHGFRLQAAFFLVWLDREHRIYKQ